MQERWNLPPLFHRNMRGSWNHTNLWQKCKRLEILFVFNRSIGSDGSGEETGLRAEASDIQDCSSVGTGRHFDVCSYLISNSVSKLAIWSQIVIFSQFISLQGHSHLALWVIVMAGWLLYSQSWNIVSHSATRVVPKVVNCANAWKSWVGIGFCWPAVRSLNCFTKRMW